MSDRVRHMSEEKRDLRPTCRQERVKKIPSTGRLRHGSGKKRRSLDRQEMRGQTKDAMV